MNEYFLFVLDKIFLTTNNDNSIFKGFPGTVLYNQWYYLL